MMPVTVLIKRLPECSVLISLLFSASSRAAPQEEVQRYSDLLAEAKAGLKPQTPPARAP